MQTALQDMGLPQPRNSVAIDNYLSNSIINEIAKQERSRTINMVFYWVRDWVRQNYCHIFWEEGKINLAKYFTKHHPILLHRKMRPTILKPIQKDISNAKNRQTGTVQMFWNYYSPVARQPDNPLKGIRIVAPRSVDYTCRTRCRTLIRIVNLYYGVHHTLTP